MSTITIHNQNLLDVAVQEYGDARAVLDLAFNNDLNVTDVLPTGGALEIADSTYSDSDVLGYYKRKSIKPATAKPKKPIEIMDGINYWIIGDDFIVQSDTEEGIGFWAIEDNFIIQ